MATHSIEAEQAVLGALMVQGSGIREIDLSPEDFFAEAHQELFDAIRVLLSDGGSADMVTLKNALDTRNSLESVGGVAYLSELSRNTPSAANISSYANIVKDRARQRKAVEIAEGLTLGVEHEGMAAVDTAISRLMALGKSGRQQEFTIKEALRAAYDSIVAAKDGSVQTVTTGLTDLDQTLGGLHPSDLIIVGARPSVGKTAFMLNLALNAGVSVGVVSGEQPYDQIGMRALARQARVSLHKLRTASLSADEWGRLPPVVSQLTEADNLRIMDKSAPSIGQVVRQVRKWAHNNGIQALYVDYVQKMRGSDERAPKREQIEEITGSLKDLARELEIPVVALAQVNRQCEQRDDKRPGIADLKESGSIEQDADSIITLYRDEVYNSDSEYAGIMECNIGKNRHGPVGNVPVHWTPDFLLVSNLSRQWGDA